MFVVFRPLDVARGSDPDPDTRPRPASTASLASALPKREPSQEGNLSAVAAKRLTPSTVAG